MTWVQVPGTLRWEDRCSWCDHVKVDDAECCEDRMGDYEELAALLFPQFRHLPAVERAVLIDLVKPHVDASIDGTEEEDPDA